MKKILVIMVLGALMACLVSAMAQQDWQSTSTMKGAGSSLAPQVTAVGAAGVSEMATTTSSKAPSGPRRSFDGGTTPTPGDPGHKDEGSPIGDALLPLTLIACAYLIVRATRKRAHAMKE